MVNRIFELVRRVLRNRAIAVALILATVVSAAVVLVWVTRYTVAIYRLKGGGGDTVFYSADGRPWFRMDEQHQDVALDQIAPDLRNAVLAIEDHRFYYHPGIDPIALARAMAHNARGFRVAEGGSTLTQQLARTLFLSNSRTWARKLKEAVLALMLEQQLSKEQILELYLNRVYLSAGIYGAETMSQKLFGKRARNLTLAEAALVAGLIRSPSALSPWSNLDGAVTRSHVVLRRMREQGFITEARRREAGRARLRIRAYPAQQNARAGYAKDFLRQQFRDIFGGDHPPGWQVRTTFVPALQEAAERAVENGVRRLGVPGLQAALVAVDPRTGDILALVGGRDFAVSQYNRATRSRRQPGSAFKPFVYAVALEQGFSPVSVIEHLGNVTAVGDDGEWTPRNAGARTPDSLTLRAALLESDNRAVVAVEQQVGTRPVLRLAKDLGMRNLPDVPSLALGTGLVSPLDLTAAYAAFPNGGFRVKPRALVRVVDAHGETVVGAEVQRERVLSEETAFQMVSMLQDVVDRGTASGVRASGIRFPVGGKTGTTDEFKDAWFVGFSSSVVVGVWVGHDQPETIGRDAYGSRLALPIWADFMRRTTKMLPARPFPVPSGLRQAELCRVSYARPMDDCPVYTEYFKGGDRVPNALCPVHHGSLRQRAERAFDDVLAALGRRLRGVFTR
jgi:penicillin-binding protein 1A